MTVIDAILSLHHAGFALRVLDGRVLVRPTANPPADAEAARAVVRAYREEAAALLAWPWESLESAARFGHGEAVLYPLINKEVLIPTGPAMLQQVLGGWAVVHRPQAERVERVRTSDVRPLPEGEAAGRAG